MSTDPTLKQILSYLKTAKRKRHVWFEGEDTPLIAAHYYCARNYSGQFSNLYKALCSINYNPRSLDLEDECEDVQSCYQLLERAFSK